MKLIQFIRINYLKYIFIILIPVLLFSCPHPGLAYAHGQLIKNSTSYPLSITGKDKLIIHSKSFGSYGGKSELILNIKNRSIPMHSLVIQGKWDYAEQLELCELQLKKAVNLGHGSFFEFKDNGYVYFGFAFYDYNKKSVKRYKSIAFLDRQYTYKYLPEPAYCAIPPKQPPGFPIRWKD